MSALLLFNASSIKANNSNMNLLDILTPLYLLIAFGSLLYKYQFPSLAFWPGIERMIYYVLFPTLIFVALVKAPVDMSLLGKVIIIILVPALVASSLQSLGFLSPNISGPTFTSMFQGSMRNNTAISLVIAAWISPESGLGIMAVIILIMIPVNNITSVSVLMRFGSRKDLKTSSAWKNLAKNPLIIACFFGLFFNILGVQFPKPLLATADFLGRSALPFALLSVGAGLRLNSFFDNKLAITLSSLAKLFVTPLLCWLFCLLSNVEADVAKIAIIFSAMPTAVSSFILAKQLGGDSETMAQIITFQTLLATLTIPLFLFIAQQY